MANEPTSESHVASDGIPPDRPDPNVEDSFSRSRFVEEVARLLFSESKKSATGLVVGLTGPWGSGKSQTLLFVREHLATLARTASVPSASKARVTVIVDFNPWLYSSRDQLLHAFFRLIKDECRKIPALKDIEGIFEGFVQRHINNLKRFKELAGSLDPRMGGLMGAMMDDDVPLEEEKKKIIDFFSKKNASVIVLVDEIDRLSDDEIRTMAQVIKSVADFSMFSYLLSYDPERVARALGRDDTKLGHFYLEKIVQVQVRLPRVPPQDLVRYIFQQLNPILSREYQSSSPTGRMANEGFDARLRSILRALVPGVLSTPRDARRLTASCAARVPFVGREVDLFDLVGYCALETRVPMLSERLQNLIARVTVDGFREMRRRAERHLPASACVDLILGEFSDDERLRDLLVYLFPALRPDGTEAIVREDTRLCYETPLMTVLNYGRLSGAVEWSAAEEAVRDPNRLQALLSDAARFALLRHAILRLRTAARRISIDGATTVALWERLGEFFDRPMSENDLSKSSSWLDLSHVFVRGVFAVFCLVIP